MSHVFRGHRPDITPAQVAAVLIAGIPALATLLATFGVTELDREQQDALAGVVTWAAVLAGLLIGGDATLRAARNVADARREAAIVVSDEDEFADDGEHVNGRGPADDPDLVGSET